MNAAQVSPVSPVSPVSLVPTPDPIQPAPADTRAKAAPAAPDGISEFVARTLSRLSTSLAPLRRLRGSLMRDLLIPDRGGAAAANDSGSDPDAISAETLAAHVAGKIVLITGGSSGIGLQTAKRVAAAGAKTIICGRDVQKLAEAEIEINAMGGDVEVHVVDLADAADSQRFVARLLARHGGVDILINNAGRSIRRTIHHSLDRFHDFERTMQLNYFGALRLITGLLPAMVQRGRGHVINISSISVLLNAPRFAAYGASKAALDAWTKCAASEYADLNIEFTTVYMPLVRTPMIAPTRSYDDVPALTAEQAAELAMRAIVCRPARIATRVGIAAEIARAVAPQMMQTFANHLHRAAANQAE
jgi:NAD(P)-dependent dehydrogenase (short-subunit alcohol dehydrogenase family)